MRAPIVNGRLTYRAGQENAKLDREVRARVRCAACGRRFAEGIATAKPSADMPDVCTDCREGIDA